MYALIWAPSALAFVRKQEKRHRVAIGAALRRLQRDPTSGDVKKLRNMPGYRLRVGNFRVIYGIDHGKLIITVVWVGRKSEDTYG